MNRVLSNYRTALSIYLSIYSSLVSSSSSSVTTVRRTTEVYATSDASMLAKLLACYHRGVSDL